MKIVHVITSFAMGGAERVACDLAAGQVSRGHTVSIVALRRTPVGQEEYAANMVREIMRNGAAPINLQGRNFREAIPKLVFKLRQIVKKTHPDIVHAHADPAEFVVALTSRLCRIHVVRTIHNTTIWPTHPIIGWLAEHAFAHESIVAVSSDALTAYEGMRQRFGLSPAPHRRVIYNGVPLPALKDRCPTDAKLRFAFFGRNTPQKGIDILARALTALGQSGKTKFQLDLFSDVTKEDFSVTSTENISVSLFPPSPQARHIMADYDALVVPSRFEGLPLVPLEAMAAGVPVIVTDAPGLREVTPPNWPLIVPVEDVQGLVRMIEAICAGKHDLMALGKQARSFVQQFSLDKQVDAYMKVYEELLS